MTSSHRINTSADLPFITKDFQLLLFGTVGMNNT